MLRNVIIAEKGTVASSELTILQMVYVTTIELQLEQCYIDLL